MAAGRAGTWTIPATPPVYHQRVGSRLTDQNINTAPDRFDNVQNWEIREAKVTN